MDFTFLTSTLLFLLHLLGFLILPDVTDQPATPWWFLALLLPLHQPAHHPEVVGSSCIHCTFCHSQATVSEGSCSTVFTIFYPHSFLCHILSSHLCVFCLIESNSWPLLWDLMLPFVLSRPLHLGPL